MAGRVVEFFGYTPGDPAGFALSAAKDCPFVSGKCIKPNHGGCSLQQLTVPEPVIMCPNRLYANNHAVLADIAQQAFDPSVVVKTAAEIKALKDAGALTGNEVGIFGKYWGSELSIPSPRGAEKEESDGFYIDYVLVRLDKSGEAAEFTAVEVQTIDTTGNYNDQATAFFAGHPFTDPQGRTPGWTGVGLNWANVSKRIIPQLIYKGYVLRRERKCSRGLFFVCPSAVLAKIKRRLGTAMLDYPIAAGTITFQPYDLGPDLGFGMPRALVKGTSFTTTVEQLAYAFVSPVNLPEMGVYEKAISAALGGSLGGNKKPRKGRKDVIADLDLTGLDLEIDV